MDTHAEEYEPLGKKHQKYNRLVKQRLADGKPLEPITADVNDVENLLRIDIACAKRDVEYVLNAFKGNDILYVSKAIKRSTWLITDDQYAHIINVKYLNNNLFPYMMSKSINKLMLKIRLKLKDEKRAEEFYEHESEHNERKALRWLNLCSKGYAERAIKDSTYNIPAHISKRLCKKSIDFLKLCVPKDHFHRDRIFESNLYLLNSQPEAYLDILESFKYSKYVTFGPKYTRIAMKSQSDRILNSYEKYISCFHFPTFAKYLNEDQIREFLVKYSKNSAINHYFTLDKIKILIKRINKNSKYECLKKVIFDRTQPDDCYDCIIYSSVVNFERDSDEIYRWYEFAPFEESFLELKKLISSESIPTKRNALMLVLLNSANQDLNNLHTVLQYYNKQHINENLKCKIEFINNFLQRINITNINDNIWSILNRLFHNIEIYTEYTEHNENIQNCLHAIIIHNAILGENIPEVVEKKFLFHTLKKYRHKLNGEEQEGKIFQYLYNHCLRKIENKDLTNYPNYSEIIQVLTNILQLLKDWNKKLQDYPLIINKIKEAAKAKKNKKCNKNLAALYNVSKSWRKYFFEESLILCPSEKACLNALKHDPGLLIRYKEEVAMMSLVDNITLKHYLNKLRVHWPKSLANDWINMCMERLKNPSYHKTTIKGLMTVMQHDQLLSIIKKYAPEDINIEWEEKDANVLSIQKYIAKSMLLSRPLLPLDIVLLYAKGDYLQYTIPTLCSVLENLKSDQIYQYVPKLLNTPVSLQKYGIRYVMNKLPINEAIPTLLDVWKSTKNASIRFVLIKETFRALCNTKNSTDSEAVMCLFGTFIDSLSAEENKSIYIILSEIQNIPRDISGKFFMKSYTFLVSLPPKTNCQGIVKHLVNNAPDIIDLLDDNFITNVMLKDVGEKLKDECMFLDLIASYLLYCPDEETQLRKYETFFAPLMKKYIPMWNETFNNKKYIRYNFQQLLRKLCHKVKDITLLKNQMIPVKLFTEILAGLENLLTKQENYKKLTGWKIRTLFIKLLEQNKSVLSTNTSDKTERDEIYGKIFSAINPVFGKACFDILKEDTLEFPSIFYVFHEVLQEVLQDFDCNNRIEVLKYILMASSTPEDFQRVIYMCPDYVFSDKEKKSFAELRHLLDTSSPPEARIYYHHKLQIWDILPD